MQRLIMHRRDSGEELNGGDPVLYGNSLAHAVCMCISMCLNKLYIHLNAAKVYLRTNTDGIFILPVCIMYNTHHE